MPERYGAALQFLPLRLRAAAEGYPSPGAVEELRLRAGGGMYVVTGAREEPLPGAGVEQRDLEQVVDTVTGYSRYTAAETMCRGYLTAPGGFRLGLCGTTVGSGGAVTGYRDLSSLSIRIPRQKRGLADGLLPRLQGPAGLCSTLILSPPGGGKTTLLRDLVRCLSDSVGLRVSLVDERGELAAMYRGVPQLEVGRHTDVLDACPKAQGVPMLLRAMNPQVIAVDEVAVAEDVAALELAAGAGVALLATVHAAGVEDLRKKPILAGMLDRGLFQKSVRIARLGEGRWYDVEDLP